MFRYVAFICNLADGGQAAQLKSLCAAVDRSSTPWREVMSSGGVRVYCAEARSSGLDAHPLAEGCGVILGTIFVRNGDPLDDSPCRRASFDCVVTRRVIDERGRQLVEGYWGNYVAILRDPRTDTASILKDPTGNLPCFRTIVNGVTVVFSCLTDCLDLGLRFSVNWSYVAARVAGGGFNHEVSALNEVAQIHRGQCVSMRVGYTPDASQNSFYWDPVSFSSRERTIEHVRYARDSLRANILACTRALGQQHRSILMRVSGGLDSSIIFGCLKNESTPRITSYTYFNPHGRSDERRWARMAVAATRSEHIECAFDPRSIRLTSMLDLVPTTEPHTGIAPAVRSSVERSLAAPRECTAVFSGEGGDSGLGSEAIGLAVDDYIHIRGLDRKVLRLAGQVAVFRDITAWKVLGRAFKRAVRGGRMSDYNADLLLGSKLVSPDIRIAAVEQTQYPHPWFASLPSVPWRTIYRLGSLTLTPEFYDPYTGGAGSDIEHIAPLYSQPVVELCLRIPIYVHFLDGRDRGLAREAFASDVPAPILRRQWKDRAPGYLEELTHRNLEFLRSAMLEGQLVSKGLLMRDAVERALDADVTRHDYELGEIYNHLDMEMWLHSVRSNSQGRIAA